MGVFQKGLGGEANFQTSLASYTSLAGRQVGVVL